MRPSLLLESKLSYRGHYDWQGMLDCLRLRAAQRSLKPREVQRALQAFSPWRSYAALNLWRGAMPIEGQMGR